MMEKKEEEKLKENINKMLNSSDVVSVDFVAIEKMKNDIKKVRGFSEYEVWDFINN